jgi:nucleoside-diphosphate-sugar epimerase
VLVPGTALVEMAVRAGQQAGCGQVEELTLTAPVLLPADGGVQLQAALGAPDDEGRRGIEVFARSDGAGSWTRHARGALVPAPPPGGAPDITPWPPAEAVPVLVDGFYAGLAAAGYAFGPAFRGLRAVWRRGDETFAEVVLPEAAGSAAGFGVHPALLDAALHALLMADGAGTGAVRLNFAWAGVVLHAPAGTALRVKLTATAADSVSLTVADLTGSLVLSAESVAGRPVPLGQFQPGRDQPADSLFGVEWVAVPVRDDVPVAGLDAADVTLIEAGAPSGRPADEGPADIGAAARLAVAEALDRVRGWLAGDRLETSRLVIMTRGAVAVSAGEGVADLAGAAVWGLARSVRSENPGRIVLADLDAAPDAAGLLAAALRTGDEPELAVRNGVVYAPRLVRLSPGIPSASAAPREPGTVLVTGGTGMLGGLVARRLAAAGRAADLVLASRSGPAAAGVAELAAAIAGDGTGVRVAACDAADRQQLTALLATVRPATAPLAGVVHTAGALDDGITQSLTPERIGAVMRPKADAAWHLHELTRDTNLELFVLFSSTAGTFGAAGQGNYAAANAFLDALAATRRAAGLPAVSLAWGPWAAPSGLTRHLADTDWARMARGGVSPLTAEQGLALLERALARDEALLVPARLDIAALRARAAAGAPLPALLRGLVAQPASLTAAPAAGPANALRQRVAGLPVPDRDRVLLDLVRTHTAAVLGHASPEAVEARRPFSELGFDSLIAVELRNRLNAATGLRLPATVAFEYPTPSALAGCLREGLCPDTGTQAESAAAAKSPPGVEGGPDALLRLADIHQDGRASQQDRAELIDAMDAESLLRMAFGGEGTGS